MNFVRKMIFARKMNFAGVVLVLCVICTGAHIEVEAEKNISFVRSLAQNDLVRIS